MTLKFREEAVYTFNIRDIDDPHDNVAHSDDPGYSDHFNWGDWIDDPHSDSYSAWDQYGDYYDDWFGHTNWGDHDDSHSDAGSGWSDAPWGDQHTNTPHSDTPHDDWANVNIRGRR